MRQYFGTAGVGYHCPINDDKDLPIDFFVNISYEYNRTASSINEVKTSYNNNGGGIKFGVRAKISKNFELFADLYEQAYGTRFWHRDGNLDGMSMEVGGVLDLSDHWQLTAAYQTGEWDYVSLDAFPGEEDIEADHDELRLGFRYVFS